MLFRITALVLLGVCFSASRSNADEPVKLLSDSIKHSGAIRAVAFSPDGKLLAVGGERKPDDPQKADDPGGELAFWDVKLQQKVAVLDGHTGPVNAVAFSPDGRILASASTDTTVRLWDVSAGKELAVLRDAPIGAWRLAFSPDGKTLAAVIIPGTDPDWYGTWTLPNRVLLWDVATHKVRVKIDAKANAFWSLAYSPDGKTLAVGCGKYDDKKQVWNNGEVLLLNPETGALVKRLEVPESCVVTVAFSPDGKFLATGSNSAKKPRNLFVESGKLYGVADGVVKLWDLATAKVQAESKVDITGVETLAFSADGKTLAYATGPICQSFTIGMSLTSYSYGEVILLDGISLKKLATLPKHGGFYVEAIAFSPVGRVLATGDKSTLKLWEIAERR